MKYSISDLEQLTGVSTHTIRIWERRYHALKPMRSAGNTRFYDGNQLRKLLNITSLSRSGLKISQVCALSDADMDKMLQQEIEQTVSENLDYEYFISQLLNYGLDYNEPQFEELLNTCISRYGLKASYLNVIYPILLRLGLMWKKDNICPAREHFLSGLIRQRLYQSIAEIKTPSNAAATWVLFLPEDEDHEIGLLFANYLIKLAGHKVIYLGARVPFDSLKDTVGSLEVDHLLLFMVRSRPTDGADEYMRTLAEQFNKQKVHVAGNAGVLGELKFLPNVDWFTDIGDLEVEIKALSHVG